MTSPEAAHISANRLLKPLILSGFLLLTALFGCFVTGLALREPDVCFLLAMGRWMSEHGQIPQTDPFAYSLGWIIPAQPYVVYQWLSEVIFFNVQHWFGTIGLLVLTAIVLSLAFIVLPTRILRLNGVNSLTTCGISALVFLTVFNHMATRPEIFAFLLTAIYLEVLTRLKQQAGSTSLALIVSLPLLMIIWCNLHCLFVVGILLVGLYVAYSIVEQHVFKLPLTETRTMLVLFVVTALASLVNPYGFELWRYALHLFVNPINSTINEMQHIGIEQLKHPFFYPYLALALIALFVFLKRIRSFKPGLFFYLLIPLGIICGLQSYRALPLSALLMMTGIGWLLRSSNIVAPKGEVDQSFNPLRASWAFSCVGLVIFATVMMAIRIVPPELPEASAAFMPPVKAIQRLSSLKLEGNLLNDPHFGDVMMWHLTNPPKLFVDSRYFLYSKEFMQDYWNMVLCQSNYQDLLRKYQIDWVFLPPNLELSKRLGKDSAWKLVYSDEASVIYARSN